MEVLNIKKQVSHHILIYTLREKSHLFFGDYFLKVCLGNFLVNLVKELWLAKKSYIF